MATFKDPTGRDWQIAITAGDLKRLKRDAGVDLRDALKPQGGQITEILDDPERFLDLMWSLCSKQVAAASVPRDDFEMLFDRETTVGAVAAVWEAVWDFSRGQKAGAEARKTLLAATNEVENATAEVLRAATGRLTRSGPTSNASASSSPELSASTTVPSPCAS